jgi:hypothetical protein
MALDKKSQIDRALAQICNLLRLNNIFGRTGIKANLFQADMVGSDKTNYSVFA